VPDIAATFSFQLSAYYFDADIAFFDVFG